MELGPEGDPAFALLKKQVTEWLKMWQAAPAMHVRIAKAWAKQKAMLSKVKPRSRWHWARGPMSAMILSLWRAGWSPSGPARWRDGQGNTWDMTGAKVGAALDFDLMFDQLLQDVSARLWKTAAKHYSGQGLEQGADLYSARLMVRKLRARGKHGEAGIRLNIVTGGFWTQKRRFDCGLEDSPLCPRCHKEPETGFHRIWGCACNEDIASADQQEADEAREPDDPGQQGSLSPAAQLQETPSEL